MGIIGIEFFTGIPAKLFANIMSYKKVKMAMKENVYGNTKVLNAPPNLKQYFSSSNLITTLLYFEVLDNFRKIPHQHKNFFFIWQ